MEMEITKFCMEITHKFNSQWKKMHLGFLKKVSSVLFPYFPIDELFNNIFMFGLTHVSLVQKFTIKSTTSFESESFLFDWITMAHSLHSL